MSKSTTTYSSLMQLPLMLHCEDIAELLGVSQQNAYALMHAEDFPCLMVGKRMIVYREAFIAWVEIKSGLRSA